jgi:hypothetical protein
VAKFDLCAPNDGDGDDDKAPPTAATCAVALPAAPLASTFATWLDVPAALGIEGLSIWNELVYDCCGNVRTTMAY